MRVILASAQRTLLRAKAKELGITMTPSMFAEARSIIENNWSAQPTSTVLQSHLPEMCKEMKIMDMAAHIFAQISVITQPMAIAAE